VASDYLASSARKPLAGRPEDRRLSQAFRSLTPPRGSMTHVASVFYGQHAILFKASQK